MEIQFSSESPNIARPGSATPKPASRPDAESDISFSQSQALEARLGGLPEIRPEVVERGRALVSQSQYPPSEMVHKIARLLTSASEETYPPSEPQ